MLKGGTSLDQCQELFFSQHAVLHSQKMSRLEDYSCQPDLVLDILNEGSHRMQIESEETLALVREAMGLQVYQKTIESDNNQESARVFEGLAFL